MFERLACWVKFSADDILKDLPKKIGFDVSRKLISMKCLILFYDKKKSIRKYKKISNCRLLNLPIEW